MAKKQESAVLRISQQIQSTLAEHGKAHREHARSFKRMVRMDELPEGMVSALGLAARSNVRHENVQRQIAELSERVELLDGELRQRVQRLEEKV
jgi:hypothetical protein